MCVSVCVCVCVCVYACERDLMCVSDAEREKERDLMCVRERSYARMIVQIFDQTFVMKRAINNQIKSNSATSPTPH